MAKYEFIDSYAATPNAPTVLKMCRWLEVSRSGFYHWRSRPVSATAARRQTLAAQVRHFFKESDGTYGYRRIHADLAGEGTECSPELVRQIMRKEALIPCQPRPFRTTTVADAEGAEAMPDLMKRDFTAARPGIKFVGDITYVHTWQGFIYLARSSTAIRRRSSDGRSRTTCAPSSWNGPCPMPPQRSGSSPTRSGIPIAEAFIPRRLSGPWSPGWACVHPWGKPGSPS